MTPLRSRAVLAVGMRPFTPRPTRSFRQRYTAQGSYCGSTLTTGPVRPYSSGYCYATRVGREGGGAVVKLARRQHTNQRRLPRSDSAQQRDAHVDRNLRPHDAFDEAGAAQLDGQLHGYSQYSWVLGYLRPGGGSFALRSFTPTSANWPRCRERTSSHKRAPIAQSATGMGGCVGGWT